jgi:hypothetical protein
MDQDLQDLLALWLGDHDPGEARRDDLLARLRADDEFRHAFVTEIHLLGMLRAAQSSEPRWLKLEDEIGWSARRAEDVDSLVRKVTEEGLRRAKTARQSKSWRRFLFLTVALAACVLIAVGLIVALRSGKPPEPPEPSPLGIEVATAIKVDAVQWEVDSATPSEGSVVTAGRLRLRSGRLTLAFFSGVSLTVEGPADLEVLAADRVFCHRGKLRARVPRGAEGFTVRAAGYEVVDLGTEFGLNLEPGGKSQVMVFEGEAAVSVLGKDGRSVHGALLNRARRSVEVEPDAGHIQDLAPRPDAFIPLGQFVPAPLDLDADYAGEILAAKPWGYWRFESLEDGRVPNEVAGRPPLLALGGVALERSPGGNGWARFHPDDHAQAFLMDGEWSPPRARGYAIELWVQADLPSPNAFGQTALVGLIDKEMRTASKHVAYLELAGRGRRVAHEPCAVRFLDRWPAAMSGGVDVFSRRTMVPSLWHHVVGQKSGDLLELYVDGEQVGTSPAKLNADDPEDATTPCRLLVGRLKVFSQPPPMSEVRPFEGRLDELAVYDHPLSLEEIRRHARARAAGATP